MHLQGAPGASLEHVLQVRAVEKRPVFAYATTGAPWLQIGRIVLDGRTARIPLKVPNVPARPGEQLQGKVQVTANGGQRFLVEVSLTISSRMAVRVDRMPAGAVLDMDQVLAVLPVATHEVSEIETIPEVLPVVEESPASIRRGRDEVLEVLPATTGGGTHGRRREGEDEFDRKFSRIVDKPSGGIAKHLFPLAVIVLLLLSVVAHDLWVAVRQPAGPRAGEAGLIDPDPYLAIRFHDTPDDKLPLPTMRFGLVMLRAKTPRATIASSDSRSTSMDDRTTLACAWMARIFASASRPEGGSR